MVSKRELIKYQLHPYEAAQLEIQRKLCQGEIRVIIQDGLPVKMLGQERILFDKIARKEGLIK